ncbi:MAG TPA: YetF domain-containing protein, partial [Thermoanaerobaculia bacterium]|nr:YetF domain-containing protein [Thermoanaerobaculia bacterium]
MWQLATPPLEILARCALVYVVVLVGLRLSGKREIGQMTPFDLVLILLIANAVQNAMIGNDNSLAGGLIAAAALLALNFTVGRAARRWLPLGRLLKGHATVLINRGVVIDEHLKREGISRDELTTALREHGVGSLDDVRLAVLEVDGSISVLKNDDLTPAEGKAHR